MLYYYYYHNGPQCRGLQTEMLSGCRKLNECEKQVRQKQRMVLRTGADTPFLKSPNSKNPEWNHAARGWVCSFHKALVQEGNVGSIFTEKFPLVFPSRALPTPKF